MVVVRGYCHEVFGCFPGAILVLDTMKYGRCYARYLVTYVCRLREYVLLQEIFAV